MSGKKAKQKRREQREKRERLVKELEEEIRAEEKGFGKELPDKLVVPDKEEDPQSYGTREAADLLDKDTMVYWRNHIGEVCMGRVLYALIDPDLGEGIAWLYLANVTDNYNTNYDPDPNDPSKQIGPFETVERSDKVFLYNPDDHPLSDVMPTEWWKYCNGDVVASEGG